MLSADRPPAVLANYLGFMLNWAGQRSARAFAERLAPLGIHPRHFGVMLLIDASPGLTQHELGEAAAIDPSSMVGVLDELEERGLAERRPHPDDRRKRTVHLTAKGTRVLEQARTEGKGAGRDHFAPLTAAERKELGRLLRKLAGVD
jgi:DNA-binding MarR family transcriptional regulator